VQGAEKEAGNPKGGTGRNSGTMKGATGFPIIALCIASAACAQDYPARPIRLISPFSPGGATDVLARIVGQKLNDRMGQPVVV
jgi:tripartite-type tricarboxylate transporter receptor subunit TctC